MKKISIELSLDESLVLFEFLSNYFEKEELKINDESETFVLSNILASLEKVLVEPFDKNYKSIIESARKKVKNIG